MAREEQEAPEKSSKGAKNSSWFVGFFHFVERVFVPVLLGVLVYITSANSNDIAEAQLALSESQLELTRMESNAKIKELKTNIQIKYIDMFYDDINSGDLERQRNALALLEEMEPEVAKVLAGFVKSKESLSEVTRQKAKGLIRNIEKRESLNAYKVKFYYSVGDSKAVAYSLQTFLKKRGFQGESVLFYDKSNSIMEISKAGEVTVGYGHEKEKEFAEMLKGMLEKYGPIREVSLRRVKGSPTGVLSVYTW